MTRAKLRLAVLAATCGGCMFQQTSTTEIRLRDPGQVAVGDGAGRVLLEGDGAPAQGEASVARSNRYQERDHWFPPVTDVVAVRRDAERAIAVVWPHGTDTLVAPNGALFGGNALPLETPRFETPDLRVPLRSDYLGGPCSWQSGRKTSYWTCPVGTLEGELATPWSNVVEVRHHVEPIGREWADFDLVAGVLLTAIGISFFTPPHTRRSEGEDVAIGTAFAGPGVLAILNGIGILMRSPYDERWEGRSR